MRMPFALGRRRYGLQHSYGSRETLPVLRSRMDGAGTGDCRDRGPAVARFLQAVAVARPSARHPRTFPARRRPRRFCIRILPRVLDPLGLAQPAPLPAYWNFPWDSNPPTYYSSRLSSGSPLKSSMAAEAAVAAACPFASLEAGPLKIPHCAKTGTDLPVPRRPQSHAKTVTSLSAGWTERSVPAFARSRREGGDKPVTLV